MEHIYKNMFKTLRIKTETHLQKLVIESNATLQNSIQPVHYPVSLKNRGANSKWGNNYKDIDKLNDGLLNSLSNKAGVYSLYLMNNKNHWELLYIGQTQSKTARQRVRSHIVWRNKKTKSGQITGSKFDEVQNIVMAGKELGFSFVEIKPAPLRHYVEEKLIEQLSPPWNKHKRTKKV